MTLSPGAKVQPKLLDLTLTGGVQRCLEFDVERASANAAAVHRAEHLDITDRIETKPAWDPDFHKLDDATNRSLGILGLDKIEVAFGVGLAEVRNDTLVDAVRIHDDSAFGGLAEHLGQAHHRDGAARDHVGQHLTGADRGQLIDITDDEQGRLGRGRLGKRVLRVV